MKQKKWDIDNISDQSGRTIIVTGSSSGIGLETARVLALKNGEVIIAVRNPEKGNKAAEKILTEKKDAKVNVMIIDLSDLNSVKEFADTFRKEHKKLDILINNAGVMVPPYSKTKDGFELQMGTNHLGHFALTGRLLDILTETKGSRIVNVSSMAHKTGNIDFDDLNWESRKYKPWKAYGDSKIANLYFTLELAGKLEEKGTDTIVTSAHPGWTATDLQRHASGANFLNRFLAQSIDMGALPTLYGAVGEKVVNGDFFGPSGFMEMKGYPKKVYPNKKAQKKAISEKLWEISEDVTGVVFKI